MGTEYSINNLTRDQFITAMKAKNDRDASYQVPVDKTGYTKVADIAIAPTYVAAGLYDNMADLRVILRADSRITAGFTGEQPTSNTQASDIRNQMIIRLKGARTNRTIDLEDGLFFNIVQA